MPQIWPSAYILAPLASPTPGCPSSWILSRDGASISASVAPDPDPGELVNVEIPRPYPRPNTIWYLLRGPLPVNPLWKTSASTRPVCAFHHALLFCVSPPRGVPEDRASLCLLLESTAWKQKEIWSPGRQAALSGDISGCSDLREKGAPGIEQGEAGDAGQHLTTHGTATTTKSRPAP